MVWCFSSYCVFAACGINYRSRIHGFHAIFSILFFDRSLGLSWQPPRNPLLQILCDRGNHRNFALVLVVGTDAHWFSLDAISRSIFLILLDQTNSRKVSVCQFRVSCSFPRMHTPFYQPERETLFYRFWLSRPAV